MPFIPITSRRPVQPLLRQATLTRCATDAPNRLSDVTLERIIQRSKRFSGLQLPPGFVRDPDDFDPPIAKMLRGGHGGEVRLKLYLTMALLAGQAPYKINPISARTWATALGLPSPETKGARRVADALNWLAHKDHPMISLDRVAGAPPTVQLLSATGNGKTWIRPTAPYVTLPLSYWTSRWVWRLSGSASALLIVLLDEQGRRKGSAAAFSGQDKKLRGISDDTWTRATKELVFHGLIEVQRDTFGEELDWRRSRNSYVVLKEHLSTGPDQDDLRTNA